MSKAPVVPSPPKLLTPAEFRALAAGLAQIDFTQETVAARLGLHGALDYEAVRALPPRRDHPSDALEVMLRLFVLGTAVGGLEIKKHLHSRFTSLLKDFNLLGRSPKQPGQWAALAMLYPLHDIWIASDRWNSPDGSPYQSFSDIVYPANANNTLEFLNWLPRDPCENFLELCAGTGVLALLAAKHFAKHAWATDIAPRSVRFAEFNRRLNGLENVIVKQGDLYDPVRGLQFDRIVAHPPYMPSLKAAEVYYDGGPDGELITGTTIREMGDFLRPGGRLFLQTLGTDRKDATFDQRVRAWLGGSSEQFDVAIIARRMVEPHQFATSTALRDGGGVDLAEKWKAFFRKAEIVRLVYGLLALERKTRPGAPFTVHRMVGEHSGLAEAEWLMRWEAESASAEGRTRLLDLKPMASARAELRVTHRKVEGELVPSNATLSTDYPFALECKSPPWVGYLLALCDSSRTVRQLCAEFKERKFIHADTPEEEFASYLATLISGGFLELEEWPLPRNYSSSVLKNT